MKKIKDERLILSNLQNIRIVFVVQTLGILCILGYDLFQGGLKEMQANPLWILFILTAVVNSYLSMNVSVANETMVKNPKKSFGISLIVLTVITTIVAYLTSITPNYGWKDGLLLGLILFICGLIPLFYVYRLRVKEKDDFEDE